MPLPPFPSPDDEVRVGAVRDARPTGPASLTVTFDTGARLRLDALDDAVLRLRYARPGGEVRQSESYARDPEATWGGPSAWYVAHDADGVRAETAALAVTVGAADGRVTVRDSAGAVLLDDAEGAALGRDGVAHSTRLAPTDRIYGLGDKPLALDRRGHRVEMWNTDAFKFQRETDPLYKSVPFLLALRAEAAVGLFYDSSFRTQFDLGAERPDRLRFEAAGGDLDFYVLAAPEPLGVVRAYARLTGRTPMLPRWALGYHQSRYSYMDEAEVREVARQFRERRIPCDALYFDIHHMRGFRPFTWDRERFPDPAALLADLTREGFRSVVIVDPGVKADDDASEVYEAGAAIDAFVRLPSGEIAEGEVWPGRCAFPDFTRPDVRAWWGGLHADLLDAGADGVWNDMNEPALFESAHVEGSMDAEAEGTTLPDDARHGFDGRGGTHAEAHNVYGMQMQRATHEGLAQLRPDRRPFTITRAAFAGSQRYGTSWTGDNTASWDHLRLAVQMCLSLGVSGLPFTGADVGGFVGAPTGELLARWTQVGALTPLFRNHSAVDTPRQEPWQFGEDVERVCREAIELRYRLLPYLYTALHEAATVGTPILRPLPLVHPADETVRQSRPDGFYVGPHLLAYPVLEAGQREQDVYLPPTDGGWHDVATGHHVRGGQTITVPTPLDHLPLFVRAGTVLPLAPVRPHTGEPADRLALHVYPAPGRHESTLFEDAGDGHGWTRGDAWLGTLALHDDGETLALAVSVAGTFRPTWEAWDVVVHGLAGAPRSVSTASGEAEARWDGEAVHVSVNVGEGVALRR